MISLNSKTACNSVIFIPVGLTLPLANFIPGTVWSLTYFDKKMCEHCGGIICFSGEQNYLLRKCVSKDVYNIAIMMLTLNKLCIHTYTNIIKYIF